MQKRFQRQKSWTSQKTISKDTGRYATKKTAAPVKKRSVPTTPATEGKKRTIVSKDRAASEKQQRKHSLMPEDIPDIVIIVVQALPQSGAIPHRILPEEQAIHLLFFPGVPATLATTSSTRWKRAGQKYLN